MFTLILSFVFLLARPSGIRIGLHIPLSGPVADYGIYCLEGIKLAIKGHPEIELIIRDNEGKIGNTSSILRELVEEGVVGIIGPIISPSAVIAGIEAPKFGIPVILPAATNTAVTKVSDYLFRVCYTDKQQGEAIAKFTYYNMKEEEVIVIVDTSNIYSSGLALHFKSSFERIGGKTYMIEWDTQEDLTDTLRKLNKSTVFLPLYYKPAVSIIKSAHESNLNIIFIGADGLDTPELFKIMKEDTEKLYFSTHYFETEYGREFVDLYQKEYGRSPNAFAALGFDSAKLLLLAIQNAKGSTPKDILSSLSRVTIFEGVTGTFNYSGRRDPVKSVFIVQLQKGKTTLVQKL
jgi:branched-chain amino acid transport system substrate-binding protein